MSTISVLYVDDDLSLLDMAKIFLERSGEFDVSTCSSAKDAIRLLSEESFDAIISDYKMPGMDGIQFLKYLREHSDATPFIIFTGKGREEVVIEALNSGADFYLQKGGDPKAQFAELSNKVRYAVGRMRGEMALRESEERYHSVVEDQTEFICRFLPDGTHLFVNDAYCRYFGLDRETLLGTRFKPVIHPDDRENVAHLFASLTTGHPSGTIDQRIIMPDGRVLWQRWSTRGFFDENGRVREYQSVGRDITEQKQADAKLQAIVQGSPVPTFVIDRQHRVVLWNRALEEYSGIPADQILKKPEPWRAFYPAEQPCMADLIVDAAYEEINRLYEGKYTASALIEGAYESTDFFPHMKGGRWLFSTAAPICDASGQVIGAIETLQDITERKYTEEALKKKNEELFASYEQITATEEELRQNLDEIAAGANRLRESEERYRVIFENTGTAMVIVEEDTTISFSNAEFCRLSGYTGKEIDGKKSWTEFVVREDLERMLAQHRFRREQHGEALTQYEFRFIRRSGEVRTIFLTNAIIPGTMRSVASLIDITGRKQAEELYQTVFENTGTAMIILEEDTTISHVNQEMEKIWGYSREEIEGRVKWPTLVAEEDLEKMLEYHRLRRIDPDSTPRNYEFRFIHKNGEFRDAALTAAMIPGTKKSVISLRDITERKQAEDALRESEAYYRTIFENTGTASVIVEEDSIITLANAEFVILSGYRREEIEGKKRWTEFVIKEDLERMLAQHHLRRKDRQKAERHYDFRFVRKNGDVRNISLTVDVIPGTKKSIASLMDITDRKRAEEKLNRTNEELHAALEEITAKEEDLRQSLDVISKSQSAFLESEENFRDFFNNAGDAIAIHDLQGRFLEVNDEICRRLGYSREELLEMSPGDIDEPEYGTLVRDRIHELQQAGRLVFETVHRGKNGTRIPTEVSSRVLTYHGEPAILSTARDITERKRAEDALRQANRQLTMMTSITRHDINNQLLALNGFLGLLHHEIQNPALEEYFTRVKNISARISSMIQFTETYTQIGVQEPGWQDARSLVEAAARESHLGSVTLMNDIPTGMKLFADPLVVKVFSNLIDNAVRYGETITTIRFSVEGHAGDQVLICEDDGAGITEGEKMHLFQQGFGKNTGFGLFLSREILSITGITITENGIPGKGARFEIAVPEGMYREGERRDAPGAGSSTS